MLKQIKIDEIVPGDNDRTKFNEVELVDLAESIRKRGLVQPIVVRPVGDGYQIVAGERRWRAARLAGLGEVECIVRELDDKQASALMLEENLKRADLDPVDEARAYQKRIEQFGYTVSELAEAFGMSESRIYDRLGLLELREDVQHLVRSKNLPLKYARAMKGLDVNFQQVAMRYFNRAQRPDEKAFAALCSDLKAKQAQLSLWDVEQFMKAPLPEDAPDYQSAPDPNLNTLEPDVKTATYRGGAVTVISVSFGAEARDPVEHLREFGLARPF